MGVLLTLPLSSREGKGLESSAASLPGPEASASGWEIRSGEILVQSHTISGTSAVRPII